MYILCLRASQLSLKETLCEFQALAQNSFWNVDSLAGKIKSRVVGGLGVLHCPSCTCQFWLFMLMIFTFIDWSQCTKHCMYICNFREGKGGRKGGRETSMRDRNIDQLPLACPQLGTWPTTQACALTGNRNGDLSVHRLALNPLSHTSQGQML